MTGELGPDPWEERVEFGQLVPAAPGRIRMAVTAAR